MLYGNREIRVNCTVCGVDKISKPGLKVWFIG